MFKNYNYQNSLIKLAAVEDKTAMDLTPEMIRAVKEESSMTHPLVEEAKKDYIAKVKGLTPSQDKEVIDQLWSEYLQTLKKLPRTTNTEFPDYQTWLQMNEANIVNWYNEHFITPKNQNPFEKSLQESGLDVKTYVEEHIAPGIYQRESTLDKFQKLGVNPQVETNNPLIRFNALMDNYSRGVAEHFTQQLDEIEPSGGKTITFVTGHPGAGKSTILELDDADKDDPLRKTRFGTLIDPDEFQPYLPGFSGGARSGDVLIYAKQLIAKKLQNEAMNRGLDIAIPLVGGQANILAKDIADALLQGYNVNVIHKELSQDESQQRSTSRAEAGGRLIAPNTGSTNPAAAYQDLQEGPEITNKITSILKDRIKEEKKQGEIKTRLLTDEEIEALLRRVHFFNSDKIATSSVTFARKAIRVAKTLESIQEFKAVDTIINLLIKL